MQTDEASNDPAEQERQRRPDGTLTAAQVQFAEAVGLALAERFQQEQNASQQAKSEH